MLKVMVGGWVDYRNVFVAAGGEAGGRAGNAKQWAIEYTDLRVDGCALDG